MEPDCLAMRPFVVAIASDRLLTHGGELAVMQFYSRKQPRVCRRKFSLELAGFDDGMPSAILFQALFAE
eukprot:1115107-Prorocentrum_lima.AAC.1